MYWIKQFGATVLPTQQPDQYAGVGRATTDFLPLSGGGVYDSLGSGVATLQGTVIGFRGTISAADQDETALETQFYALRALFGKRDLLYRQRSDTLTWEWCIARVIGINSQRRIENLRLLEVSIDFQMISPTWFGARHGAGWTLDSGEYFDTGLVLDEGDEIVTLSSTTVTGTIPNNGNAAVRNTLITIHRHTLDPEVTGMVFKRKVSSVTKEHLVIATTLYASMVMEIDCGRFTATITGVSQTWVANQVVPLYATIIKTDSAGTERVYRCTTAGTSAGSEPTWPTTGTVTDGTAVWTMLTTTDQYDNVSLGAEHTTGNWLTLEAGDNSIEITRTGGTTSDTVDFDYYDGWV